MVSLKKIVLVISLLLCLTSNSFAYEVPENTCQMVLNDTRLGDLTIYLPCDSTAYFSLDKGNPVNISGSSVTGYFTYSGEDYTISFQPYYFGRYRLDGDYSNYYLSATLTSSQGVKFMDTSSVWLDQWQGFIVPSLLIFISVLLGFRFIRGKS